MRAMIRVTASSIYSGAPSASIKVYVGSFASRREAEFAEQQHRVTQRGIKAGELPAAVDHKRTMGDALDAWLRAIKEQRSHDEE